MHVVHFGVEELADEPLGQHGADGLKQRVPAQHEADQRLHAGLAHRRVERADAGQLQRHRLLHQDVAARLGAGHALLDVKLVRGADGNDADALVGEQLAKIGEGAAVRQAVLARLGFGARPLAAQQGDHLGVRVLLVGPDVFPGDPASAEDRDAQLGSHDAHLL